MRLWVATAYEDVTGRHGVGEPVEFPDDTPEQRTMIDRLVNQGILTHDEPQSPAAVPDEQAARAVPHVTADEAVLDEGAEEGVPIEVANEEAVPEPVEESVAKVTRRKRA